MASNETQQPITEVQAFNNNPLNYVNELTKSATEKSSIAEAIFNNHQDFTNSTKDFLGEYLAEEKNKNILSLVLGRLNEEAKDLPLIDKVEKYLDIFNLPEDAGKIVTLITAFISACFVPSPSNIIKTVKNAYDLVFDTVEKNTNTPKAGKHYNLNEGEIHTAKAKIEKGNYPYTPATTLAPLLRKDEKRVRTPKEIAANIRQSFANQPSNYTSLVTNNQLNRRRESHVV